MNTLIFDHDSEGYGTFFGRCHGQVREIFLSEQRNLRGSKVKMGKNIGISSKKIKRMNKK